jgi:hypothetical protein
MSSLEASVTTTPPYPLQAGDCCLKRDSVCEEHATESSALHSAGDREERIILACAKTVIGSEEAEQIRSLVRQETDWSYLIRTASRNGVMPLVCQNLISICADLMPAAVLAECTHYWRDHARENLFQTAELIRLLKLLEGQKTPGIPLKGPALAAYAYRNLSLRQFCDLDILVHKKDIRRIIKLFAGSGFKLQSSPTWVERLPIPTSRKKDYGLISNDGRVRVEIHWRLSGPHFDLPVNLDGLWRRLETSPLAGYPARSLPLDDLLLYLTMHGSRHGWERLLFICDIAEILSAQQQRVDWGELLDQAELLGSRRSLLLGLCLAKDLLNAPLPAEILQKITSDPVVKELASNVRRFIFRRDETPADIAYWQRYHLKAKERFRERVRLRLHYAVRYLHLAFTPNIKDRSMLLLPRYLAFAYYLLRVVRLIKNRVVSRTNG